MIYHLFPGNKEHHVPHMINIFMEHADAMGITVGEQVFIVYGTIDKIIHTYDELDIQNGHLIFKNVSPLDLSLLCDPGRNDLVIIHGVFLERLWIRLFLRPELWRRTVLICWGTGLESMRWELEQWKRTSPVFEKDIIKKYFQRPQLFKRAIRLPLNAARWVYKIGISSLRQLLKRIIVPRLGAVCTMTPGEFDLIRQWYGPLKNYFPVIYATHVSNPGSPPPEREGGKTRTILGNSGWRSNDHLEVLTWLSRYRDLDLEVICPLGYPPSPFSCKDEVVDTGRRTLGSAFVPLLAMLPKREYSRLLSRADVLIQNAKRQQGLYGVYSALLNGTKVYLSPQSPTSRMLQDLGIKVHDVREISSMTFEEFSSFSDEDRERNRKIADRCFSLEPALASWRHLFSALYKTEFGEKPEPGDEEECRTEKSVVSC